MKKIKISNWDGNIFAIWGNTTRELKRAGRKDLVSILEKELPQSKSYHEALGKCIKVLEEAGFEVC